MGFALNKSKLIVSLTLLSISLSGNCNPSEKVEAYPIPPTHLNDAVSVWEVPKFQGLTLNNSWHATGNDPYGSVYTSLSDHKTNSVLLQISNEDGKLRLVGDAKSSSERVNNWKSDQTAEKFHTSPMYHNGKMYVATQDFSPLRDGYLKRRGSHIYAYDIQREIFEDLSTQEKTGVAVEQQSIVSLIVMKKRMRFIA